MFVPSTPPAAAGNHQHHVMPPPPHGIYPLRDYWLRPSPGDYTEYWVLGFQSDHSAGSSTPTRTVGGSSPGDVSATPVLDLSAIPRTRAGADASAARYGRMHRRRARDEIGGRPHFRSPPPLQPSPKRSRRSEDDPKESPPLQPSPDKSCCESPLQRFDSPMKFYASYEINDLPNSNVELDPSYKSLVNDFMDAMENNCHESEDLEDDPAKRQEMYQEQTKRFAELALRRYNSNKNNKVKYSLVEAIKSNGIFEGTKIYAHVNLSVVAKNGPQKNGPKVLAFAELQLVGDRPNAMALTSFHLLDEKKQLAGHRHLAQNSFGTGDTDMNHCYACTDVIKHPDGARYKAGHFVAMSYYYED
ncbi:uncharacterized protein LOC102706018 [Oryza brachyantha]|uniref:uncharacterized protein LOC102706018 n=1 Tax=Oryza brachyantha TaxID=4533 RepID=UPI001ADAC971|nr:uncharacterized protein LOC102706018 [Oryza brachyantha]